MRVFNPGAGVLMCAVLALVSCGGAAPSTPDRAPNLLFISVDTLRADHLGLYGYPRPVSPNLDRLAQESIVFENAHSQTSWTLASLASMMSSQWVGQLGLRDFRSRVPQSITTLAEVLAREGFETAAVGTHLVFLEKYGLRQGIGQFDDDLVLADYSESHRAITSEQVSDKALVWIGERRNPKQRWFLWLHYFDPHIPYLRHRQSGIEFGDGARGRYDGEVAFTDSHIGRVLDEIARAHSNTVVVVTSDHGEEFGDHGGKEHGHTLYQELIRVPLLIGAPGLTAARIEERVRLVDVMPTVLELLGLPVALDPASMVGTSLLPLLRGEATASRPCLSELRLRAHTDTDSIIEGRFKLIVPLTTGVPELYDLDRDPRELRNLAARRPELVSAMKASLAELTRGAWADSVGGGELELLPEEVEVLKNLGYLGDD